MNDDFGTYGKTDEFLPAQHLGHDFCFKFGRAKVEYWGKADNLTREQSVYIPSRAEASDFKVKDELQERGRSARCVGVETGA